MAIRYLTCVILTLFIYACSGIQVSQDYEPGYDFTRLKTWSWKPDKTGSYGVADNELLDQRIRSAITQTFSARGYTFASSAPADFYVSYMLNVQQKISTRNSSGSVMIGYGGYGRFGSIGVGTGTDVQSYDEGTLLIDVTDAADNKLVWRGTSSQEVNKHTDPETSTKVVNETVEKMLQQFPPGQDSK